METPKTEYVPVSQRYGFAEHLAALQALSITSTVLAKAGVYTIQHDELWKLHSEAMGAVQRLWEAIGAHSAHCERCEKEEV